MSVVLIHQGPTFTREKYEEIVRILAGGKPLTSPSDWPVDGLLVHVAGESPDGFRVVDVWESQEAFEKFGETLMPILAELGIDPGQPDSMPVHNVIQ